MEPTPRKVCMGMQSDYLPRSEMGEGEFVASSPQLFQSLIYSQTQSWDLLLILHQMVFPPFTLFFTFFLLSLFFPLFF